MAISLAAATSASALACADGEDALTNYVPTHVHRGGDLVVEIENDAFVGEVSNVVVTVDGVPTPVQTVADDWTVLRFQAPDRLGGFHVIVTWDQSDLLASDVTCSGRDDFDVIAVKRSARIGDTFEPRIAGKWRMTFTPMDYPAPVDRAVWTTSPACDVGACAFRVVSAAGWRYRFKPTSGMAYLAVTEEGATPSQTCTLADGTVIRGAYLWSRRTTIKVTRHAFVGGSWMAKRIQGTIRDRFRPTGQGRVHGCPAGRLTTRVYGVPAKPR